MNHFRCYFYQMKNHETLNKKDDLVAEIGSVVQNL